MHYFVLHDGISKLLDANYHHEKTMCRMHEQCCEREEGYSPHIKFVHRLSSMNIGGGGGGGEGVGNLESSP